jgi:hypothetical protein
VTIDDSPQSQSTTAALSCSKTLVSTARNIYVFHEAPTQQKRARKTTNKDRTQQEDDEEDNDMEDDSVCNYDNNMLTSTLNARDDGSGIGYNDAFRTPATCLQPHAFAYKHSVEMECTDGCLTVITYSVNGRFRKNKVARSTITQMMTHRSKSYLIN